MNSRLESTRYDSLACLSSEEAKNIQNVKATSLISSTSRRTNARQSAWVGTLQTLFSEICTIVATVEQLFFERLTRCSYGFLSAAVARTSAID